MVKCPESLPQWPSRYHPRRSFRVFFNDVTPGFVPAEEVARANVVNTEQVDENTSPQHRNSRAKRKKSKASSQAATSKKKKDGAAKSKQHAWTTEQIDTLLHLRYKDPKTLEYFARISGQKGCKSRLSIFWTRFETRFNSLAGIPVGKHVDKKQV